MAGNNTGTFEQQLQKYERKRQNVQKFETWDPMKEDFTDRQFNSYDRGPGRNLPNERSRNIGGEEQQMVQLYVTGIPEELTEEGFKNLFCQYGDVVKARKMESKNPEFAGTFGFIGYRTANEATEAIAKLHSKKFCNGRYQLKVQFALTQEERRERAKQREVQMRQGVPEKMHAFSESESESEADDEMNGEQKLDKRIVIDTGNENEDHGSRDNLTVTITNNPEFHGKDDKQKGLKIFVGSDSVLSNFYACKIKIYDIVAKSSEHAYQYIKALKRNCMDISKRIEAADTAAEAKRIAKELPEDKNHFWDKKRCGYMREILRQKALQVDQFYRELLESGDKVLVETVGGEYFWGSGLSCKDTLQTKRELWPGKSTLGLIMMKLREEFRTTVKDGTNEQQTLDNISNSRGSIQTALQNEKNVKKRDKPFADSGHSSGYDSNDPSAGTSPAQSVASITDAVKRSTRETGNRTTRSTDCITDQQRKVEGYAARSHSKPGVVCICCGKQAENRCKVCKVMYCSTECQFDDWPKHKLICKERPMADCRYWRIYGSCYINNCEQQHLPGDKGVDSHLLIYAREEGVIAPIHGNECYFWRVHGDCINENCRFMHLYEAQGVDQECFHWRRGDCANGDTCKYKHVKRHLGVDSDDVETECYYWRGFGCRNGSDCNFLHLPESKGVDVSQRQEIQNLTMRSVDVPQRSIQNRVIEKEAAANTVEAVLCGNHLDVDKNKIPEDNTEKKEYKSFEDRFEVDSELDSLMIKDNEEEIPKDHSDSWQDLQNQNTGQSKKRVSNTYPEKDNKSERKYDKPDQENRQYNQRQHGHGDGTQYGKEDSGRYRQSIDNRGYNRQQDRGDRRSYGDGDRKATDNRGYNRQQDQRDRRPHGGGDRQPTDNRGYNREQDQRDRRPHGGGDRQPTDNRGYNRQLDQRDRPPYGRVNDRQGYTDRKPRDDNTEVSRGSKIDTPDRRSPSDLEVEALNKKSLSSSPQITTKPSMNKVLEESVSVKDHSTEGPGDRRGRIKLQDVQFDKLCNTGEVEVLVTHFESPTLFFLSMVESLINADKVSSGLKEKYDESESKSYTPEIKEIVACQFTQDDNWYRALVNSINLSGTFQVTYLDYGNSEEVPVARVRKLDPEFITSPIQGIKCKLPIVPYGGQTSPWSAECLELCSTDFMAPLSGKCMKAKVIKEEETITTIDLTDTTIDMKITDVLISKNLAQSLSSTVSIPNTSPSKPQNKMPKTDEQNLNEPINSSTSKPMDKSDIKGRAAHSPSVSKETASPQHKAEQELILSKETNGRGKSLRQQKEEESKSEPQFEGIPPPPPIAPLPIPSAAKWLNPEDVINVTVVEMVSPDQLWIQVRADELKDLENLQADLNLHYSKLKMKSSFRYTGHKLHACKFSADGQWYRALAYDADPSKVSVLYLDFGNREFVSMEKLHALEGKFCSLPFQAVCCCLYGITGKDNGQWSEDAIDFVRRAVAGKVLKCRVNGKDESCVYIELLSSTGKSLNAALVNKGYAVLKEESQTTSKNEMQKEQEKLPQPKYPTMKDLPELDLGNRKEFRVQVVDAPSPTDLCIQIMEDEFGASLLKVTQALAEKYIRYSSSYSPKGVGELLGAKFEDGDWYRAKVLEIQDNGAKVIFLDYGNIESVTSDNLAALDKSLMQYPSFGLHCCLSGISGVAPEQSWDPNIVTRLWKMNIVSREGDYFYVDLIDNDIGECLNSALLEGGIVNAGKATVIKEITAEKAAILNDESESSVSSSVSEAETVIEQPIAKKRTGLITSDVLNKVELKPGSDRHEVMFCHFEGPQEIYVQLLDMDLQTKSQKFSLKMNNFYKESIDIHVPDVGELVVAFSQTFKEWFRATVLNVTDNNCILFYVDYGNTETSELVYVRKMEKVFTELPQLAVKCSMFGLTEDQVRWSGKSIQEFEKLTKDTKLYVTIDDVINDVAVISEVLRYDNDTDLVQLLVDKRFIREENLGRKTPVKTKPKLEAATGPPLLEKVPTMPPLEPSNIPARTEVTKTSAKPTIIMAADFVWQDLSLADVKVTVCHAESIEEFYVQYLDKALRESFFKMSKALNEDITNGQNVGEYVPKLIGESVACLFLGEWYRGEVLEKLVDNKFKVSFFDYGNCEELAAKDIRKLHQSYASIPKQGIKCCFSGIQVNTSAGSEGQWSKAALEWFSTSILNSSFKYKLNGNDGDSSTSALPVDLYMEGSELTATETMIEKGFAVAKPVGKKQQVNQTVRSPVDMGLKKPPKVVRQTGAAKKNTDNERPTSSPKVPKYRIDQIGRKTLENNCLVSVVYIANPLKFVCQDPQAMESLVNLTVEMKSYCEKTPVDPTVKYEVGDLCCALYSLDREWYRTEVKEVLSSTQLKLYFIDYGNTETQDIANIRPFHESFKLDALAIPCSLHGIPDDSMIPEDVTQEFNALALEKLLQCRVMEKKEGVYVVKLTTYGTDLQTDVNEAVIKSLPRNTLSPVQVQDENTQLKMELEQLKQQMALLLKQQSK